MSERNIEMPFDDDQTGVEGAMSGPGFSGEFGERDAGDTAFIGEHGERVHEGRASESREAVQEEPPL